MEYLVLSPEELTKYHANIVERFCLDNGIEGSYDAEHKRYNIYDQEWVVVGGGKFEINTSNKTVRLYDDSMAYGKFDSRGLPEKVRSFPAFSEYAVVSDE